MNKINKSEQLDGEVLSQKVYSLLRKKIIDKKYKSGQPILESSLSNELGISRTPIREALKLLEKENLVNVYHRKGAFITTISLEKIREIFQIREIVEGEVARLAAPYIANDKLSQIEKKLLSIRRKMNKGRDSIIEEAVVAGRELHDIIFSTIGNKTLIQTMESLRFDAARGCDFASQKADNILIFLDQHLEIIRALKEKNGEKAKKLLNNHIKKAKESTLD